MSDTTVQTPAAVLVAIEDNPADVHLVKEGVDAATEGVDLAVINSGQRAIAQLTATDGEPREPDLILLDLNLPGKSGFEVLEAVRADSDRRSLPVVVVSSSRNGDDIRRAYELGANAYVVKPDDPDEYIRLIETIVNFWLPTALTEQ